MKRVEPSTTLPAGPGATSSFKQDKHKNTISGSVIRNKKFHNFTVITV